MGFLLGFIGFLGIAEVLLVIIRKEVFLVKGIVTSSKTQEKDYFLRFFTLK